MLVILFMVKPPSPVQPHHVEVEVALLLLLLRDVLMLDAFSPPPLIVPLRLGETSDISTRKMLME